uniref:Small nuclear ribonucleoprotein E n=1 Tax=Eptatretus burgeri TaxID=7764 RepID=A0A8C4QKD6_EPTBU
MAYRGQQKVQKVMVQPINLIFRYLQNRSRIQIWLYEQVNMRIEGCIIGFDEYMNLVLDDAEEIHMKTKARKPLVLPSSAMKDEEGERRHLIHRGMRRKNLRQRRAGHTVPWIDVKPSVPSSKMSWWTSKDPTVSFAKSKRDIAGTTTKYYKFLLKPTRGTASAAQTSSQVST